MSLLDELTRNGTRLPIGVPKESYDSTKTLSTRAENYTLPMHLLLLKCRTNEEIANALHYENIHGFKKIENGISKVQRWREAAIGMAASRNAQYLKAWRNPTTSDMLEACESLMPDWVKGFGVLITNGGGKTGGDQGDAAAKKRWGDKNMAHVDLSIESNATGEYQL
jgi:hypothetical protein